MNGDGRDDLAVVASLGSAPPMLVFLQDSTGKLAVTPNSYPAPSGDSITGSSIAIGDVTGDGRNDVVVTLGSGIGVFVQNASGALTGPISYAAPINYKVRIGDVNGDGRLDVVALQWSSSSSQNVLLVFLQDSTGALTAPVGYSAPLGGFNDLDLGDVTGDGKTDVVVMSGQGLGPNVSVLAQTASGTLAAATSYSVTGITDLAGSIGVGDVTGDGHGDIVLGFSTTTSLAVLEGAGTNPFASQTLYTLTQLDGAQTIAVGDVTGDGKNDAIVAGAYGEVRALLQQPDGSLRVTSPASGTGSNILSTDGLALGDLNGGQDPLVSINPTNNEPKGSQFVQVPASVG